MQEEEVEKIKKDSYCNIVVCFYLEKKVVVFEFVKNYLNFGGRKIVDYFGIVKILI